MVLPKNCISGDFTFVFPSISKTKKDVFFFTLDDDLWSTSIALIVQLATINQKQVQPLLTPLKIQNTHKIAPFWDPKYQNVHRTRSSITMQQNLIRFTITCGVQFTNAGGANTMLQSQVRRLWTGLKVGWSPEFSRVNRIIEFRLGFRVWVYCRVSRWDLG